VPLKALTGIPFNMVGAIIAAGTVLLRNSLLFIY
jgi:LPS O-antigen subunit length determinant protein (WzzB/FepE family)